MADSTREADRLVLPEADRLVLPEADRLVLPEADRLALPEAGKLAPPEAGKLVLPEAGKLNVFISYSRDDLAFADHLDVALELAGFAPTLDRHGIHGAENWEEKLHALIRAADTIVFVLSPSSAASGICAWEVDQAVALGKRIIPVAALPLGATPAPPALAALNYIYFYPEPKKPGSGVRSGSEELIKALKLDLAWMQKHTRYLQRALEWDAGGRKPHRLLLRARRHRGGQGMGRRAPPRRPRADRPPRRVHQGQRGRGSAASK